MTTNDSKEASKNFLLGIPTDDIANLSVDEIVNNKQAVTMVFHFYKIMADENTSLKNERNTLQTYVSAFELKKSDSATAAILLLVSNISIGLGINLLTNSNTSAGVITLIPGICLAVTGLYFQFFKERSDA
jgi:hypothetical protein